MKHVSIIFGLLLSLHLTAQITYENAFPNLNFEFPVEIQNSGIPGDDRLFVVEQPGRIKVFNNDPNVSSASTFLNITSDVYYNTGQELGLLGLAFHPNYAQNGYFYLYYTQRSGGRPVITVERIRVQPNNANAADLTDRQILFEFRKNQSSTNHNGGKITFGADGYLYISVGDGGGAGDPNENAQNKNNIFGAILRIDVDVDGNNPIDNNGITPDGNYELPSDNPFVGQNGENEIYAWGIRNTWKMNFDRQTNRLWGGDVGQNDFEEINLIELGDNYGWSYYEANQVEDTNAPFPNNAVFPIFDYSHSQGDVSITGGYVYRGNEISSTSPSLFGQYVFGDYVSGRVWSLEYDPSTGNTSRTLLFRARVNGNNLSISTFGEDLSGELYFTDYGNNGAIYKLVDGTTNDSADAVAGVGDWCDSQSGTNGIVYALADDENDTYVGGEFSSAGNSAANNVAKWDGANWSSLGSGTNGRVNAIAIASNGDVYVGGNFTKAGNTNANNIARWNGNSWQALGNGTSGPIATLAFDSQGNLYVGGAFQTAGNTTVNNVALWNGSWNELEDANNQVAGTGNEIRSMAIDENDVLYVGGNFGTAGGNSVNRIATWNGTNWGTLGAGTSGFVQALLVRPNYIYAGGNFAIAGGNTVNRIARWNRTTQQWEALENGLSNVVNALAYRNGYVYVGGAFDNALNTSPDPSIIVNNIARWSNSNGWEALGSGTDVGVETVVNALNFGNETLFVGGNLSSVGSSSNTVNNFTCWEESSCVPTLEVSGTNVSGLYKAANLVFTSGTTVIQNQATFEAGETVRLEAGFEAPNGTTFIARIVACQSSNVLTDAPLDQSIKQTEIISPSTKTISISPNPFNGFTTISYELEQEAQVNLWIVDANGRKVVSLLQNQMQMAGDHQVNWAANHLESGFYFVLLQVDGERRVVKALVE